MPRKKEQDDYEDEEELDQEAEEEEEDGEDVEEERVQPIEEKIVTRAFSPRGRPPKVEKPTKEVEKVKPSEEDKDWLEREEKRIKAKLEEIKKKESFDNFIRDAPILIRSVQERIQLLEERMNKMEDNFRLLLNNK